MTHLIPHHPMPQLRHFLLDSPWCTQGDKPVVQQMMSEFEWLIKTAVESAQVDPLEVTLDPRIQT